MEMEEQSARLSAERTDRIREALLSRNVSFDCPACGAAQLKVMDRYTRTFVANILGPLDLRQPQDVTSYAMMGCERCGFVRLHSLGYLGLL